MKNTKNKIGDLRDHLFEVIEQLKDEEHPMDLERARAIADIASVVVDTAKVEIAFIEAVGGGRPTDFFPDESSEQQPARVKAGK